MLAEHAVIAAAVDAPQAVTAVAAMQVAAVTAVVVDATRS
jgi:hypothetical protein